MEKHFDELLSICTQEHGKTLEESKGDVRRGIDNVETARGHALAHDGAGASSRSPRASTASSVRQPMGVFAIIAPYNFPSMVPVLVSPVRDRDAATPWSSSRASRCRSRSSASSSSSHEIEAPAGGRQHGARRARRRERHPRAPGHRGRLVRRLDRRSPSTSTRAAARPESACRRSAARRTSAS